MEEWGKYRGGEWRSGGRKGEGGYEWERDKRSNAPTPGAGFPRSKVKAFLHTKWTAAVRSDPFDWEERLEEKCSIDPSFP